MLINSGVLHQALIRRFAHLARPGDDFDINLDALTGEGHLLVRLGFVDLLLRFGLQIQFVQHTVQTAQGPGISPLPQPAPQFHPAQFGVAPAHVPQQCLLFLGVLLGV